MIGDGYTSVVQCEHADASAVEPDARPVLCTPFEVDQPGRVRRFNVGDRVNILRAAPKLQGVTILTWHSDPLDYPGFSHCAGKSAKYWLTGYDGPVYDWQLEAAVS